MPIKPRSDAHASVTVLPARDDTAYEHLLVSFSFSANDACDEARPPPLFLPTDVLLCGESAGHVAAEQHGKSAAQ
jgi:hypothetical protein